MKFALLLAGLMVLGSVAQANSGDYYVEKTKLKRMELALAMAKALQHNSVCEADAYPEEIVQLLYKSGYEKDSKVMKSFVKKISPTSPLLKDYAFREVTGSANLRAETEAEFLKGLIGTRFHAYGMGAYGSPYNVTFLEGGIAVERKLELLDEEPWVRWIETKTEYELVRSPDSAASFEILLNGVRYRLEPGFGVVRMIPVEIPRGEEDKHLDQIRTSTDSYCDA